MTTRWGWALAAVLAVTGCAPDDVREAFCSDANQPSCANPDFGWDGESTWVLDCPEPEYYCDVNGRPARRYQESRCIDGAPRCRDGQRALCYRVPFGFAGIDCE
jgi:hypothetical protein